MTSSKVSAMTSKSKDLASGSADFDVSYKILLLGDSGVGKTSLIQVLTGAKFVPNVMSTVGIDFVKVIIPVDGVRVQLQIWDTAGQERFRSMTRFHFRGTMGLLLVYDITNRQSFEMMDYWIGTIEKDLDKNNQEAVPILIVANKCDLNDSRAVSKDEGKKIASRNIAYGFWETSAADSTGVRECFINLAKVVVEIYNPELMSMYKISAAIEQERSRLSLFDSPSRCRPIDVAQSTGNGSKFTCTKKDDHTVKLQNKCQRTKCDCA